MIWLDEVQYTPGGWTNRNRMPDGSWLTAAVQTGAGHGPVNRVYLSEQNDWRRKAAKTLRQHYPVAPWREEIIGVIARPYRLLVGMNMALLFEVFRAYGVAPEFVFQSHLDGGHAVQAVSETRSELLPISARLAMMVREIGGTVYLSGPSGRNYLDPKPFDERGVEVRYWDGTDHRCVLDHLAERRSRPLRIAL